MYKDCLFKHEQNMATYHQIRSIHNTLYTDKVTKLTLTPQDDKRYLMIEKLTRYRFRVIGSRGEVLKEGRLLHKNRLAACQAATRCLERMLRQQLNVGAQESTSHKEPLFSVACYEVLIPRRMQRKSGDNCKHIRSSFEYVMESIYVDELKVKVNELCNGNCYGCEVDHPSQVHHQCLMMEANERVDYYFDAALSSMPHRSILDKAREQMKSSSEINTECYQNVDYLNTSFFSVSRKERVEQKLREKMRDF
ncbi:uncharacterized protein [Haliotis asinina]|uniref:uncharacterized protein n=1 Tax=Haliotis asinina TaxID=109174 RepID=UPI0035325370